MRARYFDLIYLVSLTLQPYVLSAVRKAEEKLLAKHLDKEYAPITGVPAFCRSAVELAYGTNSEAVKDGRIAVTQSISGTGALRIGGEFLARFYDNKAIYVPTPTWSERFCLGC